MLSSSDIFFVLLHLVFYEGKNIDKQLGKYL